MAQDMRTGGGVLSDLPGNAVEVFGVASHDVDQQIGDAAEPVNFDDFGNALEGIADLAQSALLKRYHQGGLEAVDPRSRRPASNPRAVNDDVIVAIVRLRENLVDRGLDP